MAQTRNTLTIILGPTAVGKTDYAIKLAKEIGSPILNCDSRQIFKELTIGTAVPSKEQLSEVKHYFIQTNSITEHYTAGRYELEALALLKELFKEHNRIIMCGGSGLYIDAVCNGLDAFPEADLKLRHTLNIRLKEEGLESLRYELKQLDPESYAALDIANPQRIVRALEVTLQTGKKFSEWKSGAKERPFAIEKIGLNMEREKLYSRINQRVDKMMSGGLLDEVKSLDHFRFVNGELKADLEHIPSLRTVGYRELFDYLDGKTDLETAVEAIKMNTRRYAKRQVSYWGRDKSISWINL
ncbi:MAG: tRNA (adenosine(37)-N6)-dimethylallyltransferase MiaA [Bacteroidales bacterium]|nr:tRNA (adenosine(37)-N6)-dimethylallyltransferase MiaA [Bacteroidales bacterium]